MRRPVILLLAVLLLLRGLVGGAMAAGMVPVVGSQGAAPHHGMAAPVHGAAASHEGHGDHADPGAAVLPACHSLAGASAAPGCGTDADPSACTACDICHSAWMGPSRAGPHIRPAAHGAVPAEPLAFASAPVAPATKPPIA